MEKPDNHRQSRDRWIDLLSAEVSSRWGAGIDRRAEQLLVPWVTHDQLAFAALLSSVAADDVQARSPETIVERLRGAALFRPKASRLSIKDGFVLPIIRNTRKGGAPWERWWDVSGLHVLLIELLAGRRLEQFANDRVLGELRSLWSGVERYLPAFLDNAADPFVHLPPDLLIESGTGMANQVLRRLIGEGKITAGSPSDFVQDLPELADRKDLAEIVVRLRHRLDLEAALRSIRDIPPDDEVAIRLDLSTWDERFTQLKRGLTMHESRLMKEMDSEEIYRDKCLQAGRGLYEYWLLRDDALPPEIDFDREIPVPGWIHDEVVTSGGRSFRTSVGPHSVWLAALETPAQLASMRTLANPGTEYGVRLDLTGDVAVVRLVLPLGAADPGPPLEIPYYYPLSAVNSAWQLMHLGAVGRARLIVVRLTEEGEPRMLGSIVVGLPPQVQSELTVVAVEAFRRLVGDETHQILWRRGTEGYEQAAKAAFHGNETAKGEDLREEFALMSANETPAWEAFRVAAQQLAQARARNAVAALDGHDDPILRNAVQRAVEERQRCLEIARADSGARQRHERREDDIAQVFQDDQTAFVHLFIKNDRLSSVAGLLEEGLPRFEMLPDSNIAVDRLIDVTTTWSRQPQTLYGQDWYYYLSALLASAIEIVQPFAHKLLERGIRRIFLSPTPPLDLLPLHMVPIEHDSPMTLCEAFEVVAYAPSAQTLSAIQNTDRRPAPCPALAIAHTGARVPGLDPIGAPPIEAQLVADLYPGARTLFEEAATPDAVLAGMADVRIVHIASHGFTQPDRWASGIALHGDSLGKATLTTSKILAAAALSSVDLVVLNACRTGTHESTTRTVQTLRGVESAFLARGAKAVISTFWEISSLHAMVFSALLHARVAAGESIGEAYSESIIYLRRSQWHLSPQADCDRLAATLLDRILPDWRDHLSRQAETDPLFWAAFKITGTA